MLRKIIHIDEEKCDGCGLCAEACAEGAIAIMDGKARLVSESYCDGLGACLGECPKGAITILEREVAPFDEVAVRKHLGEVGAKVGSGQQSSGDCEGRKEHDARGSGGDTTRSYAGEGNAETLPCGCPGTVVRELQPPVKTEEGGERSLPKINSRLRNWPIQLRLLPITAPYLKGAHILLAADCTAFAFPEFHRELLEGKILTVGCPKLDDASFYREKLAAIIAENGVHEITVVHMEVPCCFGLANIARQALEDGGSDTLLKVIKLGINGEVLLREELERRPEKSFRH